jgi:hypothetical protein
MAKQEEPSEFGGTNSQRKAAPKKRSAGGVKKGDRQTSGLQKKVKKSVKTAGSRTLAQAAKVGKQAKEIVSTTQKKIPEVKKKVVHAAEGANKGLKAAGSVLGKALKKTAKATGKLAGVANVKAEKAAERHKIRKLFQKIGQKYYTLKREGKSGEETGIDSLVQQVDKAKEKILKLEKKEKRIRSRPL